MWVTDNRDIHDIRYDDVLLERCGLDREKLPNIIPANSVLGTLKPQVAAEFGLPESVQVVTGSGDNHSAVIGSGAVRDFDGHCYIGTTSWISCHLPFKKTDLFHMMASFPAALPGKYLLLAQQGTGGECLKYLRDVLFADDALSFDDLSRLAESSPPGANGLVFTPWLTGALTPADDHFTRSAFFNQTLKTTRADYVRAVMEGVACNLRWLLPYTEKFVGRRFPDLRFIGGGAQSDLWCQILADVLDRQIHQVAQPRQANVRGAAFAAFLALNRIQIDDVPGLVPLQRTFTPSSSAKNVYHERLTTFIEYYRRNKGIYTKLNTRR
jgi:xylulokinase